MSVNWQPYREPFRITFRRTAIIAAIAAAVWTMTSGGGLWAWPRAVVLMMWPSLGGHYVEIFFLNWLRPRLPDGRAIHVTARLATWFLGGCILGAGMLATAALLSGAPPRRAPAWWEMGLAFIGIELVVHLVLKSRGVANFYDGRG